MHPKDLVSIYCKFTNIKKIGYTLKKDILKELSIIFRSSTNKELIERAFFKPSSKVNYNNIFFLKEMGFDLKFIIDDINKCYSINLKNSIEMPPFPIKTQTYFHYLLIEKLQQISLNNNKLKKYFDSLGFYDDNLIKLDFVLEPNLKIINKIFLNDIDYIAIEYLESDHINKYTGLLSEKLRISNTLIFSKEEKCKRCYVFWENKINNIDYFNNFINDIVKFIENYYESLDNYLKYKIPENLDGLELSKNLIEMFYLNNKTIKIDDLNKKIDWISKERQVEFHVLFKVALHQLGKLNAYEDGLLNKEEFDLYIQKLNIHFVKDDFVLEYWSNLKTKIQNEYQKCLIEYMNNKIYYYENSVYGLEDY